MLIFKIDRSKKDEMHNALTGEEAYVNDTIVLGDDPDDESACLLIVGGETNEKEVFIDAR